jgi:hypothetical protein
MTFLEIAQFVCEGPEFIDGVEAGRVKERLKREYRLIWDSFTWKDSQEPITRSVKGVTLFEPTAEAVSQEFTANVIGIGNAPRCDFTSGTPIAQLSEAGTAVTVSTTGTLPEPLTADTVYYLSFENAVTDSDFDFLPGIGEDRIIPTTAGTGTHTVSKFNGVTTISNGSSVEVDMPLSARWNDNNELTAVDRDYLFRLCSQADIQTGTPTCFAIFPRTASGLVQIRMYPYPNIDGELTLLVKRKLLASELLDTSTPVLRGVENVLIAMGEAHLFMRANLPDRAQEAQARAADRLRVMKDMETNQQASVQRIVPVEDRYDFHYPGENRTKGYW